MIARLMLTINVDSEDEAIDWSVEVANALSSMCVEGELGDIEYIDEESGDYIDFFGDDEDEEIEE